MLARSCEAVRVKLDLTHGSMSRAGPPMSARPSGRAEDAYRVALGPIVLIVRDVDDDGRISAVGLSFEPVATTPRG